MMLLLPGCTYESLELRKHTYPPSLTYVPQKDVDSAMWSLAEESVAVNDLLRRKEPLDGEGRSKLIEHLDRMISAAGRLDVAGRTNHPLIDANIGRFMKDVELARAQAASEQPNYFLAGSVAGACVYCHAR
jgi:hypothetical protein